MANPYGPILEGIGLISGGKLSDDAKKGYTTAVTTLLLVGNGEGRNVLPLLPIPPVGGPELFNITTFETEPLFWFKPDPLAALMTTQLADPKNNPLWHKIFVDFLYEKTALALNVNGSTPFFPIFDVSVIFPQIKKFPIALPELAIELSKPLPALVLDIADAGIKVSLPEIPIPPIPPLPTELIKLDLPSGVLPPIPPFPTNLVLIDLITGLVKIPIAIIPQLVTKITAAFDLPNLPNLILSLMFDALIALLKSLGLIITSQEGQLLILPKLFIASILMYVRQVVSMICVVVVGLLVGADGALSKTMASLVGLV